MRDPWVLRCPKGHASLETHEETYRCGACADTYEGEPYDVREVESFPVADDTARTKPDPDDVLEAVVERVLWSARPYTRAKWLDIDARNKQIGQALAKLHDDGLVERNDERSRGYGWKPTAEGVRWVRQPDAEGAERGVL